jgi:hypothetical protein
LILELFSITQFYQVAFTSKGITWDLFLYIEYNNNAQAYHIEKQIKKKKSEIYSKFKTLSVG